MAKSKTSGLASEIQAYLRALAAGKAGYKKADQRLEGLIQKMKPGQAVELPGGQTAELIDKFAVKNRIGAGLGVNRYEIEVSRAEDLVSKL